MRTINHTLGVIFALIMTLGALLLTGVRVHAQSAASSNDYAPTRGGGLTTTTVAGGVHIDFPGTGATTTKPGDPVLKMRPGGGLGMSEFSASVEFESWKDDLGAGVNKGNRQTILTGYTKELNPNTEVSAILPYQFIHVNGIGQSDRFDDAEVNYRHYSFDATDPSSLTTVYGLKVVLPTGSAGDLIGLGRWGIGPSATTSKPCGKSLLYVGGNYTLLARKSGDSLTNPYMFWLGGVSQIQPKTSLQYEATWFKSDDAKGTNYLRVLVGPRFAITPTASIQVNLKQELQAKSKSTIISIGYSNRM